MRRVRTLNWALPDGWYGWAHDFPRDMPPQVSDKRYSTAAVEAAARSFEDLIATDLPGTAKAALWVPEFAGGLPLASVVLRLFAHEPPEKGAASDASKAESMLERARTEISLPRGVRLLDRAAVSSRVPAGDAILQIVDTTSRFRRRVSREWSWYILPPRCDEFVLVHLESSSIAHFSELAGVATDIAGAVEITLGRA